MAIIKEVKLNRVLITFNADGSFKGAHKENVESIMENGVSISEKYMSAQPIIETDLSAILPTQATLLAQNTVLSDRVTELEAMLQI